MNSNQPAYRPPSAYLHGGPIPITVVPARVAAWLERNAGLNQLRIESRGNDPEVDNVLVALHTSALTWRTSVVGSDQASEAEELPRWITVQEAAYRLYVTDRAVRLAIQEGRLKATRQHNRWLIATEDFIHYQNARNAA